MMNLSGFQDLSFRQQHALNVREMYRHRSVMMDRHQVTADTGMTMQHEAPWLAIRKGGHTSFCINRGMIRELVLYDPFVIRFNRLKWTHQHHLCC